MLDQRLSVVLFVWLSLSGSLLLGASETPPPETKPNSAEATPKAEPTKTEPSKTEPSKTEPSKTEPTKTEPTESAPEKSPEDRTVEQLTELAKKSVVEISVTGRDGKKQGLGTGFVIDADGLIATNLHVIGEARPITVQLHNGQNWPANAVHASQRGSDLAIIRIDARNLIPLELGDSDALKQGQAVVALGNPLGLKYSVVNGVVSGRREIEGRQMIQLAMPIEPGNSGGPLLDMQGRVHGIITMKSLVTANLGFAMPVNALKPLIESPNTIVMDRWLTIGALDPREWTQLFGAKWRQHSGRISVEGQGKGFGGRALCLSEGELPELPFEVAVTVKLGDEDGAAGLVFGSDGDDQHFGFYPSNGKLRLSKFNGPDVFSWQVLVEKPSEHYRSGDWNRLKVRLEKDKILCFINEELVISQDTAVVPAGKVGLAKFRETAAEFKLFQAATEVKDLRPSLETMSRVAELVAEIAPTGPLPEVLVDQLIPETDEGLVVLRERAKLLEKQAAQLRKLALAVHQKSIRSELGKMFKASEDEISLIRAALLIAELDNDEVDPVAYEQQLDRMERDIVAMLPENADESARVKTLNKYLFEENGFHGSRGDYYNRANSYLNEVIDDREGLPITLSVLYMELGRRIDLKLVGIGLPGHFVVALVPKEGERQLIDVYEGGVLLTRDGAASKIRNLSGRPLTDDMLEPVSKRDIVIRMLHNLMGIATDAQDVPAMLRYVETMVSVAPDAAQERWFRAVLRYQSGMHEAATEDVEWLLERNPDGIDLNRVRELGRVLDRLTP